MRSKATYSFPVTGTEITLKQTGSLLELYSVTLQKLLLNTVTSAVRTLRHHSGNFMSPSRQNSESCCRNHIFTAVWLRRLTKVVSSQMFLQLREKMEVRWSLVWAVRWVVQGSETKAANLCSRSCAHMSPRIVILEENLLHAGIFAAFQRSSKGSWWPQ
jgi:hypothetical protein